MLKVEISKDCNNIAVDGTMQQVLTDLTVLLKIINDSIDDKYARKKFVNNLKMMINDEIFAKSEEEIEKLNAEKQKEFEKDKEDFDKKLKELFEKIKSKFGKDEK